MLKLASIFLLAALPMPAAVITIDAGFPFSPSSVTVTAGDTIHWQFLSGHNVQETNDPLPGSATYNGTGFQSPCCSASTFDWVATVGNHTYYCVAHQGFSMYGHIHVLPPPTATATPTATPSQTPSSTPTDTPTMTVTLTATESHTISPTFTESETFTPGPSLTFSSTASHSPSPTHSPTPSVTPTPTFTVTATPTISPTPSFSPTHSASPTESATSTPTPKFAHSPNDKVILGPVPVKAGNPLCLAFPAAPYRTLCELYNGRGELVAREKFDAQVQQCLSTQNLAPGLYFANIEEDDSLGNHKKRLQKIVILP